MTLSGAGWLLVGYRLTPLLVVKLALVAVIWMMGPLIDKVAEPKFSESVPGAESGSPTFLRALRNYLLVEALATGLFYLIVVMWVLA